MDLQNYSKMTQPISPWVQTDNRPSHQLHQCDDIKDYSRATSVLSCHWNSSQGRVLAWALAFVCPHCGSKSFLCGLGLEHAASPTFLHVTSIIITIVNTYYLLNILVRLEPLSSSYKWATRTSSQGNWLNATWQSRG